ncbi:hypothetical protein AVEN_66321-1 [Araneus ventricosus]|uniref:Uncharacterized protein n=1 Tax=Araneus ventricosus TaxID=182803 RepID=A0A4Y2U401_ARAVE|nr:hypothetical protein AVEN_66321-1 [Araneus ventricosus]
MTKRSISSLTTTTDGCLWAKARAEFTIKQSASSSDFLHAMFNEENLFIRMEVSLSLFFRLARNFSWETVDLIGGFGGFSATKAIIPCSFQSSFQSEIKKEMKIAIKRRG